MVPSPLSRYCELLLLKRFPPGSNAAHKGTGREGEIVLRLRTDFWVSAYLRRCDVSGLAAVLRRRGAAEAGALYVKLDWLDGRATLYGPAPQGSDDGERRFLRLHRDETIEPGDAETRLKREIGFDSDIWIVEVESRDGTTFLDLVA